MVTNAESLARTVLSTNGDAQILNRTICRCLRAQRVSNVLDVGIWGGQDCGVGYEMRSFMK